MKRYSNDSQKNRNRSAADEASIQNGGTMRARFADNRPDVIVQRNLQKIASDSPRTKQFKALKKVISNASEKAPIQRTGKDAYNYLKSRYPRYDTMGAKNISAGSLPFYLTDPQSPLNPGEKIEFLRQYNLNLPGDQQVAMDTLRKDAPQEEPKPQLSERGEVAKIWAPGKIEDAYQNALNHFNKHVGRQREFDGKFRTLIEYVRAARAFWGESGGITTLKGDKGLVVKFDPGSGKYTFSADDGGKIATFFELRDTGNPGDIINQIVEQTGMDKGIVRELLSRVPVEKKEDNIPFPRQQNDDNSEDKDGSGDDRTFVIDGMVMDEWDAYEYMEYKKKVDF